MAVFGQGATDAVDEAFFIVGDLGYQVYAYGDGELCCACRGWGA